MTNLAISNIKLSVSTSGNGSALSDTKYLYLNTSSSSSLKSSTILNKYNIRNDYSVNDLIEMNQTIYNYDSSNSSSISSIKYWDDAWSKYKESSTSGSGTTTSTTLEFFVTKFFKERTISSSTNDSSLSLYDETQAEELLKEFNTIQYSAYLNLMKKGLTVSGITTNNLKNDWFTQFGSKLSEEEKVELALLGINFFDSSNVFQVQ